MPERILNMKTDDLLNYLLSEDPAEVALAEAEIDRILDSTPEINPGYQLPQKPGVVRYDSDVHTMADVSKMSHYLRQRIELGSVDIRANG